MLQVVHPTHWTVRIHVIRLMIAVRLLLCTLRFRARITIHFGSISDLEFILAWVIGGW